MERIAGREYVRVKIEGLPTDRSSLSPEFRRLIEEEEKRMVPAYLTQEEIDDKLAAQQEAEALLTLQLRARESIALVECPPENHEKK
ncbi:hypothetical protein [Tumebacillus lipolyticus]|uniref:Uncharacterized protein n=1 Tax=Tumebacillus lipolyticus TaxID=1280370 RepID=A0ABW4ZUN2_9BACL